MTYICREQLNLNVMNKFSFDFLPENFRAIINAYAKAYQLPEDMVFHVMFSVFTYLCQYNRIYVKFGNYKDRITLFNMIIAEPSVGKTPCIKSLTQPVYEIEKKRFNRIKFEYAGKLEKTRGSDEFNELLFKQKKALENNRCTLPGDLTPEALLWNLSVSNNALFLIEDEGQLLFDSMRRHRNNSMHTLFSTLFDGKPLAALRKTTLDYDISDPRLSTIIGLQPVFAERIFTIDGICSGFTGRWLISYFKRNILTPQENINLADKAAFWNKYINDNIITSNLRNATIEFPSELYEQAQKKCVEMRYAEEASIYSNRYNIAMKVGYFIPRITAVIHFILHPNTKLVSHDELDCAFSIFDTFLSFADDYDNNRKITKTTATKKEKLAELFRKGVLTANSTYEEASKYMNMSKITFWRAMKTLKSQNKL